MRISFLSIPAAYALVSLSLIATLPLAGCRQDKMNDKNLTTTNVKRDLPATPAQTLAQSEENGKQTLAGKENTPLVPADTAKASPAAPRQSNEVKPATATREYHIITASHPRESLALEDVDRLKARGYQDAQVIVKDNRYRVSITHSASKQEITEKRNQLASELGQDDIWVLRY